MRIIEIGIAKMAIAKTPIIITTKSLGSCVAIILYDSVAKVGAMAHIMLPNSKYIKNKDKSGKFVDTAIPAMINQMIIRGAVRKKIVAKLVGGAKMFKSVNNDSPLDLGRKIIDAAKKMLRKNGIRIVAQDIGKDYGRTVEFDTSDGSVMVKMLKKGSIFL